MKEDTQHRLAKAHRDLTAARRDLDAGDAENALSHAYYAAFHAAVAALHERGLAARTHSGVGTLFYTHFVRDGPFGLDEARTLSGLQQQREAADYGVGPIPARDRAATWVTRAEVFVATVEALLSIGT